MNKPSIKSRYFETGYIESGYLRYLQGVGLSRIILQVISQAHHNQVKSFLAKANRNFRGDEHGATMLEAALALPVVVIVLVFLFYICWASATNAILNDAARRGADLATKIPNLDNDTRNLTTSDYDYEQYRRAVVFSIQEAVKGATASSWFYNPDVVELLEFEMPQTDLTVASGKAVPKIKGKAAIILPGKTAQISDTKDGSVETLTHPVIPPSADGKPLVQSPKQLMAEYPIRVILRARVRFLGFLPMELTAQVDRQRQKDIPKSELPDPGDGEGVTVTTTSTTTTTTDDGGTTTTTTSTTLPCVPDWGSCEDPKRYGPNKIPWIAKPPIGTKCRCIAPAGAASM